MSSSVLANMAISLGLNSQKFEAGIGKAQKEMRAFGMAANKLEGVNLNGLKADFDRQVTSLSQLQKQAREFGKALRLATDEKDIKALNRQLEETYAEMKRIKSLGKSGLADVGAGANSAAKGMDNMAAAGGQVNTEFARLISDAPYAVNNLGAIGNNVSQLAENFKSLRAQTGSTRAAWAATFSSMLTPMGGLMIGISLLTAGFTAYQMWQQKAAKSTKDGAAAMKSAEQAADEYVDTLDSLTQARVKGDRDAQKELTTLRLLYKQTQNTALSTKERVKAVDELQKQYPSYFGNLTDEEVLAGKAASAYDKLSKSILAVARAQAARQLITDKASLQLVNEQQIADLERQQLEQEQAIQKAKELKAAQDAAAASMNSRGGTGSVLGAQSVYKLTSAYEETVQKIKDLRAQNKQLSDEMLRLEGIASAGLISEEKGGSTKAQTDYLKQLQEQFDLATKQAVLFGSSYDELGVKADLFKTAMVGLMEQGLRPQDALIQQLKSSYDLFASTTLPQAQTAIEKFANTDLSKLRLELTATAQAFQALPVQLQPMSEQMRAFFERMAADAAAAMNKIEISAETMTNFMQNAIGSAITGFAESLGQLATTGNVQGFFDGIIGIVADFASDFGKLLIASGLAALAFEQLQMAPGAAIAAGVALVAAAGAVKSLLAKGPGGSVSSSYGGGGMRGVASNPVGTSYDGPAQYEFILKNDVLVAAMDRAAYRQRRVRG